MITPLFKICEDLNIPFYGEKDFVIKKISTDTRKINKNDFFIGLKGEKFDGSEFIFDIKEYASGILINKDFFEKRKDEILKEFNNIVVSNNPNRDFLRIVYYDFDKSIKIFAITGSYGKTTCKYFLYKLLSSKFKVLMNEKNYNNIIGIANTISYFVNELNLVNEQNYKPDCNNLEKQNKEKYDFLVIEIGTNHMGEIPEIVDIIRIDYAFITCIGNTHLEHFKNKKNIFFEKISITKNFNEKNIFFVNIEDKFLRKIYKDKQYNFKKIKIEHFKKSDFKVIKKSSFDDGKISTLMKIGDKEIKLPFIGEHNIKNFYYCYKISQYFLGEENKGLIYGKINELELPEGRANIKVLQNDIFKNTILIEDCYNSNPDSLKIFLNWIFKNFKNSFKVLIIGDMLELGDKSLKFHIEIIFKLILKKNIIVLFVGDMFFNLSKKYKNILKFFISFNKLKIIKFNFYFFSKVEDLIINFKTIINENYFLKQLFLNDQNKKVLFIKGSHGINLKKFIDELL